MTIIDSYLKQSAEFDPETLSVMGAAYERALQTVPSAPKSVREVIASRIICSANDGERDPNKLFQHALSALRIQVAQ